MNRTNRYRFRATTYAPMGQRAESVEFIDTLLGAATNRAIDSLTPRGLPGTGRGAAGVARVVGVRRLEAVSG